MAFCSGTRRLPRCPRRRCHGCRPLYTCQRVYATSRRPTRLDRPWPDCSVAPMMNLLDGRFRAVQTGCIRISGVYTSVRQLQCRCRLMKRPEACGRRAAPGRSFTGPLIGWPMARESSILQSGDSLSPAPDRGFEVVRLRDVVYLHDIRLRRAVVANHGRFRVRHGQVVLFDEVRVSAVKT